MQIITLFPKAVQIRLFRYDIAQIGIIILSFLNIWKFHEQNIVRKKERRKEMNLILCSENCKHQKDGYCCLDEYGRVTDVISSPCVYFDSRDSDGKSEGAAGKKD